MRIQDILNVQQSKDFLIGKPCIAHGIERSGTHVFWKTSFGLFSRKSMYSTYLVFVMYEGNCNVELRKYS